MQTKIIHYAFLTQNGLLQVEGVDAKKLLQGQLTCDLEQVAPAQSQWGAHCNPQGRVLSFFRIFYYQNSYFLAMPRDLIPAALAALQKYAVFFKVKLSAADDHLQQLGCIDANNEMHYFLGTEAELKTLEQEFAAARKLTAAEWEYYRITQTIPAIYPETTAKFLPHELNLPALNAISFNKGCYTGQEIIARMQYRGKLKNRLFLASLSTATPLARGAEIYCDDRPCGSVVDYCSIGYNNYKLLVIAPEADVQAKTLHIGTNKLEFE